MPPEDGVEGLRGKEDEETPLHILPSGSRGVTATKNDINTLRFEVIMVNNDNEPAPDNVYNSEDVLPAPETVNFGFQGINPWCQSGNSPVGKARLKMVSNISV